MTIYKYLATGGRGLAAAPSVSITCALGGGRGVARVPAVVSARGCGIQGCLGFPCVQRAARLCPHVHRRRWQHRYSRSDVLAPASVESVEVEFVEVESVEVR